MFENTTSPSSPCQNAYNVSMWTCYELQLYSYSLMHVTCRNPCINIAQEEKIFEINLDFVSRWFAE